MLPIDRDTNQHLFNIVTSRNSRKGLELLLQLHKTPLWTMSKEEMMRHNQAERTRLTALQNGPQPDYGTWRRNHGNAGYGAFVDAHIDYYKGLSDLNCFVTVCRYFYSLIEQYKHTFGGADELTRLCQAHSRCLELFIAHRWDSGISRQPLLLLTDVELCMRWVNVQEKLESVQDGISRLSSQVGPYDASRLLSARTAESSAVGYYSSLYKNVSDISLHQINALSSDWLTHDIEADGRPIDVKNARRSFSSPDAYVEHCVPRFKESRQTGEHISITGVLSDYVADPLDIAEKANCLILGESSRATIDVLMRWFANSRFSHFLSLDGLYRKNYLPGWIFEYPTAHYTERSEAMAISKSVLDSFVAYNYTEPTDLRPWLLTLNAAHPIVAKLNLTPPEKQLLSDMASMDAAVGLTRPSLYLYVMAAILEATINRESIEKKADLLTRYLFVNQNQSNLLGLVDSQRYVFNLINILQETLEKTKRERLVFNAFQMTHPAILKGRTGDHWVTLLAYCGGWKSSPIRTKCGRSPLTYAESNTCNACGRLICPSCGFCLKGCSSVSSRQKQFTAYIKRPVIDDDVDYY